MIKIRCIANVLLYYQLLTVFIFPPRVAFLKRQGTEGYPMKLPTGAWQ